MAAQYWTLSFFGCVPIDFVPSSGSPIVGIPEILRCDGHISNILYFFKHHDGIVPKKSSDTSLEIVFQRKITRKIVIKEHSSKHNIRVIVDDHEIMTSDNFNDIIYYLFNSYVNFYSFN
jgi:hypothetical protein